MVWVATVTTEFIFRRRFYVRVCNWREFCIRRILACEPNRRKWPVDWDETKWQGSNKNKTKRQKVKIWCTENAKTRHTHIRVYCRVSLTRVARTPNVEEFALKIHFHKGNKQRRWQRWLPALGIVPIVFLRPAQQLACVRRRRRRRRWWRHTENVISMFKLLAHSKCAIFKLKCCRPRVNSNGGHFVVRRHADRVTKSNSLSSSPSQSSRWHQ